MHINTVALLVNERLIYRSKVRSYLKSEEITVFKLTGLCPIMLQGFQKDRQVERGRGKWRGWRGKEEEQRALAGLLLPSSLDPGPQATCPKLCPDAGRCLPPPLWVCVDRTHTLPEPPGHPGCPKGLGLRHCTTSSDLRSS